MLDCCTSPKLEDTDLDRYDDIQGCDGERVFTMMCR